MKQKKDLSLWRYQHILAKKGRLRILLPPHAVYHYRGARVASQRCPILHDSTCIIHIYAGISKAINPKDLCIVNTKK